MTRSLRHAHLRAAGTSLLVVLCPDAHRVPTPVVLHWGPDLGPLTAESVADLVRSRTAHVPHGGLDAQRWLGLLPESATGFTGVPAVEVLRPEPGESWSPRLTDWTLQADADGVTLTGADAEAGVEVRVELELTPEGLVRERTHLTNRGPGALVVLALRMVLPVGASATEVLDLTGRWTRERQPQRRPFQQGVWLRAGRHGRTGHDATLVMVAGTAAFSFRSGTVWAVHLGWSGDHEHYAERTTEGESLLGARELLGPAEVTLVAGATYTTPWMHGSWSDRGLDGLSARLHAWYRRVYPLRGDRPVLVNTWEAVYFDHDPDRLLGLAREAAAVGAERFVLDDGWFAGRHDDRSALGDWRVDPERYPHGLHPLIDQVHALGMDFGLWVEPEMVNVDSDLARAHPDWILRGRASLPPEWRHQQVLDLQNEDAYEHLRASLLALLGEYDIAFVKWDHNRDLVDVAHSRRPAVHGQTLALYRLLDELRAAHPQLEIESCASGGGRVDLGILERTDRVWASDTVDAVERQQIQRWTTLLLPPEVVGAHVGAPVAHTTGRHLGLDFRAATALIGHFGVEWDLSSAEPEERRALADWVARWKELRALVAAGELVRGDHPDPALLVTGVVAPDAVEALFVLAAVGSAGTTAPVPVSLPGLQPGTTYDVQRVGPDVLPSPTAPPEDTWPGERLRLPGSVLAAGIVPPVLLPETALVLHLRAR